MRAFRFATPVYPIIDPSFCCARSPLALAEDLLAGGAKLVQVRAKDVSTRELCDLARAIRALCDARGARLLVNDRADVARMVEAAGVHLGQTDLPPADARRIVGPSATIGLSTHSLLQVEEASRLACIDYIGYGPIFRTSSKENAGRVQGLKALQAARLATNLPIVAIGGITELSALEVLAAGADAVAMIGALASSNDPGAVVSRVAHAVGVSSDRC